MRSIWVKFVVYVNRIIKVLRKPTNALWYKSFNVDAVDDNVHSYLSLILKYQVFKVNSVNDASSAGLASGSAWAFLLSGPLFNSHSRLVAESALASASSWLIAPSCTSFSKASSNDCEPGDMLFSIASLIWPISPFSIRSEMWRVLTMTSTAAVRVPPLIERTSRCDTMAFTVDDRSCSSAGRFSIG